MGRSNKSGESINQYNKKHTKKIKNIEKKLQIHRMSWEAYVTGPTGLIARSGQHIESAGIYGINGVTWAQSGLDNLNTEELASLNYIFDDPSSAQASGFTLNGQQFA